MILGGGVINGGKADIDMLSLYLWTKTHKSLLLIVYEGIMHLSIGRQANRYIVNEDIINNIVTIFYLSP